MDILKGRKRAQSTSTLRPPTDAPTSPSSGLSAWVRRARSKSPHPASASSSPRTEPAPLPSVAAVTVASNTTTASTPESPKPPPATTATIENTPKSIPSPALVSPRAPTVTGTPPGRPPTHWWSQSPIERTRRAWDDDPDAEERWTRTRDRVDDALRRVLDTTASVTHEGLAISVDLLQLVPFPGLAEAAKTLLYIWDGVQLVDLNRMQCLRITERCANILISVRDEVVEATQHDNGIPADLEYPLRRLVDAFAQIQAFLNQQAHRPFIKRYLKRDDILRQLQGCDAALQDAVDAFGCSTLHICAFYPHICAFL
ncbi:uncharacterized protein SCHCODRAFT_02339269 [Schizophyllum commune H4-8]|uniref:uncharacterized protein n=1 Tax=Schizophyllum commune (strain H4-8 / FGSC 9210) TaxID=578458 RepID=UPI00215E88EA|nr:uncharacterized protein SCHCODRAFT_02339269 [Schizophyllum commune H4-8]KAI5890227.1 hypothetical protein SCHCODRAFT_02339269 [Schizophyllum commune H4-8]